MSFAAEDTRSIHESERNPLIQRRSVFRKTLKVYDDVSTIPVNVKTPSRRKRCSSVYSILCCRKLSCCCCIVWFFLFILLAMIGTLIDNLVLRATRHAHLPIVLEALFSNINTMQTLSFRMNLATLPSQTSPIKIEKCLSVRDLALNGDPNVSSSISSLFRKDSSTSVDQKTAELYIPNLSSLQQKNIKFDSTTKIILGTLAKISNHSSMSTDGKQKLDGKDTMREILSGAHFIIEGDSAQTYLVFSCLQRAYIRGLSSHYSLFPQLFFDNMGDVDTLLFGTTIPTKKEPNKTSTWMQTEGAEWTPWNPFEVLLHIMNFLEYRLFSHQVGPMGNSRFTEANPLIIKYQSS